MQLWMQPACHYLTPKATTLDADAREGDAEVASTVAM
jgi:hypothetical protein